MPTTNSVSIRLMAWVMALCPLSLAILFHTGLQSRPLSIAAPKQPALAFRQYCVDLRTIRPSASVEAVYTFENRGKEPVRITRMEASCNCVTTQLHGARDNVIQSGSQARVIARMQPGNTTPGPHEYVITVYYTDPEPREVQLLFKMDIPATLWVTPHSMSIYHPAGAPPTLLEFTVTDGRKKPFDITGVSVNTDLVEAVIGESGRTPAGNFEQKINVTVAGDLPPGRATYLLRIATTDTDIPELRVPLMLEGEAPAPENKEGQVSNEEPIEPDHEQSIAEIQQVNSEPQQETVEAQQEQIEPEIVRARPKTAPTINDSK